MSGNRYHVTRIAPRAFVAADVYGHSVRHCDPTGCNGHELRLGSLDDEDLGALREGDTVTVRDGKISW